jgi:hypothetical protein
MNRPCLLLSFGAPLATVRNVVAASVLQSARRSGCWAQGRTSDCERNLARCGNNLHVTQMHCTVAKLLAEVPQCRSVAHRMNEENVCAFPRELGMCLVEMPSCSALYPLNQSAKSRLHGFAISNRAKVNTFQAILLSGLAPGIRTIRDA